MTALAGPVAVLPAALIGLLVTALSSDDFGFFVASIVWLPMWIGSTAVIWRDTPLEAVRHSATGAGLGPKCPKCGYNLSGLTQARCPECGMEYTLDELFSSITAHGDLG